MQEDSSLIRDIMKTEREISRIETTRGGEDLKFSVQANSHLRACYIVGSYVQDNALKL